MKSFSFRLEAALRWRTAQVEMEQNRAGAAAVRLQSIRSAIDLRTRELSGSSEAVTKGSSGDALQLWASWVSKCKREISELGQHAHVAEQALAASLRDLIQANQNRQLIEKLKQSAHSRWEGEVGREVEAFASETFLRQVTIKRRTGA